MTDDYPPEDLDDGEALAQVIHGAARGRLSDDQLHTLLRGIHPSRISTLQGHSHLEGWDVRRWLIRVFGHGGFDTTVRAAELVAEWETDERRPVFRNGSRVDGEFRDVHYFNVIYRSTMRLDVRDLTGLPVASYEDVATGDAKNATRGDAHDQALKGAATQALKRCAVNLGDLFGLSLYNGGKLDRLVLETAESRARWPLAPADQPADPPPDPPVQPEPDTTAPDPAASSPPPAAPPAAPPGPAGFPPARGASPQERDGARTYADAAESHAQRGGIEGVKAVWRQASAERVLDVVPAGASKAENLITLAELLTGYAAIAREIAAAGPPAPTGEVPASEPAPGASVEDWAGVAP